MITAVPGCVDTCAILPQPCRTHGVRVPPASRTHLRHRAAPSGAGVPGLACRYVPRTCAPGPQVSGMPEDAPTPRWAVFLAGALAGCTATCLCYPLDVVPRRGQRWPGSQNPLRPPAAPKAHPPARGGPLRPGAAPSPLRGAEVRLRRRSGACPQVADAASFQRRPVGRRLPLPLRGAADGCCRAGCAR